MSNREILNTMILAGSFWVLVIISIALNDIAETLDKISKLIGG